MRTVIVTTPTPTRWRGGPLEAAFRIAFDDDADRPRAVTRLWPGTRKYKAIQITCPEACAAISSALAMLPPRPVAKRRNS